VKPQVSEIEKLKGTVKSEQVRCVYKVNFTLGA